MTDQPQKTELEQAKEATKLFAETVEAKLLEVMRPWIKTSLWTAYAAGVSFGSRTAPKLITNPSEPDK